MGINTLRTAGLLLIGLGSFTPSGTAIAGVVPELFKSGSWEYELETGGLVYFEEDPDGRHRTALNASLKADYYTDWNDGDDSFVFSPFITLNQRDSNMSYVDISELTWVHVSEEWETRIGIRQEKWGTVLVSGVVDVINTSSGVFSTLYNTPKLGQPMINFSRENEEYGTLDLYVLTGFRETNYPGSNSRPALPLEIDDGDVFINNNSEYFPGLDYAVRWVFPVSNWEVGLSYFNGVGRGNDWLPRFTPSTDTDTVVTLSPVYNPMEQVGLELSWTKDGLTFNFEGMTRSGSRPGDASLERYGAAVVGTEYDFGELFDTRVSAQGVLQYLHDDRKDDGSIGVFRENDILTGINLNFNDERETSLILSSLFDVDTYEQLYLASLSTNLNDQLQLSLSGAYVYIPLDPIEADINDLNNLSPEQINSLITTATNTNLSVEDTTNLTNALVAASLTGNPADLINAQSNFDQLQRYFNILADENKLRILENESFVRIAIKYYF